jgi:hypothetical protein
MTCEIVRRPVPGEACIVTAWPIERGGRKMTSGTALFTREGELLARSHQIWIGRAPALSPLRQVGGPGDVPSGRPRH